MKKMVFIFLLTSILKAQWMINPLDNGAANKFFIYPEPGNLHGLGTGNSYVVLSDDKTNKKQGEASLKVEWHVNTSESWGGFAQLQYLKPIDTSDKTPMDWSMASYISIWYNNISPSTKKGSVHMRFKIHEAGGSSKYWSSISDHEDWYFESAVPYDAPQGWTELKIPLKAIDGFDGAAPNDQGFSLPGWSGTRNNGVLDLDKVIGYSIEFSSVKVAGELAEGICLWDNLTLQGTAYPPLSLFEDATQFTLNKQSSWDSSNKGDIILSDEKVDVFEGKSSLKVNYKVHGSQSWGGYVGFETNFENKINLASNTNLYLMIKNVSANTLKGKVQFRFILFDKSGTGNERWYTLLNFDIDKVSDWTLVKIPLVYDENQSWNLAPGIFINPPDPSTGHENGKMDLTGIGGFGIEFSGQVKDDNLAEGIILFDVLTPAGFQETDKTPPAKVSNLQVIPGNYSNIITWNDVPNETGEKYSIFYSTKPITNINAPGVEELKSNIQEEVKIIDHILRAPKTDQDVSYYYAIFCIDKAGNVGELTSTTTAITNKARGVPVISLLPPTPFKADGNLDEWKSISPIKIKLSDGTGFLAPNTVVDNDNDLSVEAYIAIDKNYLYVAFDINDDIVKPDVKAETYLNDSPDLFIGLYNFHGKSHTGYQRGLQPDYHLRFNIKRILNEGGGGEIDPLVEVGNDYIWKEKFPNGYVVESRISLNDLMNKRNNASATKDTIYIKEGMRIPIDFSINDNDTGERNGILTYSPTNRDMSWSDVSLWTYTWVGDKWEAITSVSENEIPDKFELYQNYPNPFNPTTTIKYSIPTGVETSYMTSLRIYDILGKEVATLVNERQPAGNYEVKFDGSKLSSGVYFYKLQSGSFVQTKKFILMK